MRENEEIENKGKSKIRRIASLDFQRGLAIWMMVFFTRLESYLRL